MNDTRLIEALSNASSLELFDLSRIIDRLLADPRRIVAIRNKLNLGKSVRFMDWRTGQMRAGKIVAITVSVWARHLAHTDDSGLRLPTVWQQFLDATVHV